MTLYQCDRCGGRYYDNAGMIRVIIKGEPDTLDCIEVMSKSGGDYVGASHFWDEFDLCVKCACEVIKVFNPSALVISKYVDKRINP